MKRIKLTIQDGSTHEVQQPDQAMFSVVAGVFSVVAGPHELMRLEGVARAELVMSEPVAPLPSLADLRARAEANRGGGA